MNSYRTPINSEIHRTNYTHTKLRAFNSIIRYVNIITYDATEKNNTYNNLNPGLYKVNINNGTYYFILTEPLLDGETLYIVNADRAYIKYTDGTIKFVLLYKHESILNKYESDSYNSGDTIALNTLKADLIDRDIIWDLYDVDVASDGPRSISLLASVDDIALIENDNDIEQQPDTNTSSTDNIEVTLKNYTVNTYIDKMVFEGRTFIEDPSLDNDQATLKSISTINLQCVNANNESESNSLQLKFKNNIKSLPSGVCDTFYMDCNNCSAFILFRIGRTIITGNENFELVEDLSSDDYKVFYYAIDRLEPTNDGYSIRCSHLPTSQFNEMKNNDSECIALDSINNGAYIKIAAERIADTNLNRFFRSKLIDGNPVVMEYLLKTPIYKTVLLDEYHINTYYNSTRIVYDVKTNAAMFIKSIK